MMNKEKTTVIIIIHLSILPEETFPLCSFRLPSSALLQQGPKQKKVTSSE